MDDYQLKMLSAVDDAIDELLTTEPTRPKLAALLRLMRTQMIQFPWSLQDMQDMKRMIVAQRQEEQARAKSQETFFSRARWIGAVGGGVVVLLSLVQITLTIFAQIHK